MSEATATAVETKEVITAAPGKKVVKKAAPKKVAKKAAPTKSAKKAAEPKASRAKHNWADKIVSFLKKHKTGEASSRDLVVGVGATPGPGQGSAVIGTARKLVEEGILKVSELEGTETQKAGRYWKLTAKGAK